VGDAARDLFQCAKRTGGRRAGLCELFGLALGISSAHLFHRVGHDEAGDPGGGRVPRAA
jgi:hypothetical protein